MSNVTVTVQPDYAERLTSGKAPVEELVDVLRFLFLAALE